VGPAILASSPGAIAVQASPLPKWSGGFSAKTFPFIEKPSLDRADCAVEEARSGCRGGSRRRPEGESSERSARAAI